MSRSHFVTIAVLSALNGTAWYFIVKGVMPIVMHVPAHILSVVATCTGLAGAFAAGCMILLFVQAARDNDEH